MLAAATSALASDMAVLQNGFTIRCEHREVIGAMTRLYPNTDNSGYVDVPTASIDHFEKDLSPTPTAVSPSPSISITPATSTDLKQVVEDISGRHHIDPDLINSVIHAESGFNAHAVSPKGAQGLMQLMPQTSSGLGVTNAFDPEGNVDGGTRYLLEMLERYNFDLIKALAAYNAGPYRVDQYRGVPPYQETRAYVARVIREFNRKKLAERAAAKTSKAKTKTAAPMSTTAKTTSPVVAEDTER